MASTFKPYVNPQGYTFGVQVSFSIFSELAQARIPARRDTPQTLHVSRHPTGETLKQQGQHGFPAGSARESKDRLRRTFRVPHMKLTAA